MNTLDKKYQELLQDILDNGIRKEDRTGTGTISVFGRQIRHKMSEGFPLLTTKKVYFKGIVTELLWFLRGDTNIKYLVDNDCHIWDGDAYQAYTKRYWELDERDKIEYGSSHYNHETNEYEFEIYSKEEFVDYIKTDVEFAKKFGDLGPIYGKQWRKWEQKSVAPWGGLAINHIDQIANLIRDLKTNPDSRRLMVSAWNPADLEYSVLPPCHYGFQVYTRELSREERIQIYVNQYMGGVGKPAGFEDAKLTTRNIPTRSISLMFNMRSNDVPLGLPFNLASYGLLLEIIAKVVNMVPDELIANLGDAHIYVNQIDGVKEQLTREPYPLPILDIHPGILDYDMEKYPISLFEIKNYQSHPTIKMPLSN